MTVREERGKEMNARKMLILCLSEEARSEALEEEVTGLIS
jgi:hypothetical protein